jgi:hypothetical protein
MTIVIKVSLEYEPDEPVRTVGEVRDAMTKAIAAMCERIPQDELARMLAEASAARQPANNFEISIPPRHRHKPRKEKKP